MNILIVDDNKNNRMILSLLLEDYSDENTGSDFQIDEASDGLEAIDMCNNKGYDLILMDIMMPNMDGIEATKIIRETHKKTMIIAVSAVDDGARQKLILSNGAEDYISKPVNADIFNTRISNYIKLINSRDSKISNDSYINIFTKNIFSRNIHFVLSSEDTLSELWEYYLVDSRDKDENLSDIIRTVFSIAEVQFKLKEPSNLYVEESEEYKYFTITGIEKVPEKIIMLILKKNSQNCDYKILDDKISFKLQNPIEDFEEILPVLNTKDVTVDVIKDAKEFNSEAELDYKSVQLEVFDYIDPEDMVDLEEYAGKLNSLMLLVGSGDVSEEEATDMYTYIDRLGSILSTYSEVYVMSNALAELSSTISAHLDEFRINSEALGPICTAFSNDLSKWISQSFYSGAPSADFMNDTIVVNCQTIGSMLKMDEAPAEGFEDDIFDF